MTQVSFSLFLNVLEHYLKTEQCKGIRINALDLDMHLDTGLSRLKTQKANDIELLAKIVKNHTTTVKRGN